MYRYIGPVPGYIIQRYKSIEGYKHVSGDGRDYYTVVLDSDQDIAGVLGFEKCDLLFAVKLRPGGFVHLHTDTPRPQTSIHIPVETNKQCVNRSGGKDYFLSIGYSYEIDRGVPHESFNNGKTDRVHLIAECV